MNVSAAPSATVVQSASESPKLRKAAREFEAMLLADLMKTADPDSEKSDAAGQGYDDMRIQAVSQSLAEHGGIGIAQMLVNQLHGAVGKTD